MKKYLAALSAFLSLSSVAQAETMFYASNQGGGYINLTDKFCGKDMLWFYSTDQNGNMGLQGCYTYNEPYVLGADRDGKLYQWAMSGFSPTQAWQKKYGR